MKQLKNTLIILLTFLLIFILIKTYNKENNSNLIFSYPSEINFAWELLDCKWSNYYNKQRFDKEFLITSKTMYQFILYIKRYPLYIPYIEKRLEENDIPDDFKYLAIAESALLNNALSTASAAWIWQFMPDTARQYWLKVDNYVDERYNFEKSTNAAIKYIEHLYKRFWNRTLVAAAYNRWEWWIKRALEKQAVDNYYDLYINEETSRYVFRILAIKYTIEDYFNKKWIIDPVIWWIYEKPKTKTIKVFEINDLIEWSKEKNLHYKDVILLNQWINWTKLPKWEWEIKVLD